LAYLQGGADILQCPQASPIPSDRERLARLSSQPFNKISDHAKAPVIVLIKTLSTLLPNSYADTEFFVQFSRKARLRGFSVFDLTSRKLPEPSEFLSRRSTGEQNTVLPLNDRGCDNPLAGHGVKVTSEFGFIEPCFFTEQSISVQRASGVDGEDARLPKRELEP
jgi:hypothetical protein